MRKLTRKWNDKRFQGFHNCGSNFTLEMSKPIVMESFWQPLPTMMNSLISEIVKPVAPFNLQANSNYRATIDFVSILSNFRYKSRKANMKRV